MVSFQAKAVSPINTRETIQLVVVMMMVVMMNDDDDEDLAW